MKRNHAAEREFARLNELDWDEETAWFSGVLQLVNPNDPSTKTRIRAAPNSRNHQAQNRGAFSLDFDLPGLPGEWRCRVGNLQSLFAPETIRPIRALLVDIANSGGATKKVWRTLQKMVGDVQLTGGASLGSDTGSVLYKGGATVSEPTQWMALLIAELIARGFDDRVGICELPSCENVFVAWERRGKPRLYCSDSHAGQDRTAASRLEITAEELRLKRRRKRK